MNVKEVKVQLWEPIIERFKGKGFQFNKKSKWLERKFIGGQQIIDLLFYTYPNQILVEPIFRIKINLIEDIYHMVSLKEEKFNYATKTLGNSLGQIIKYYDNGDLLGNGEQITYMIENAKDLNLLKSILPGKIEKYILPYFESFSSIEKVNELLNERPEQMTIHHFLYPIRACIGIIAAKLLNRSDYNKIVELYEKKIDGASPEYKKEFEDLKKLLSTY